MQYGIHSQHMFLALEDKIRQHLTDMQVQLGGSFSDFYRWLYQFHPEVLEQAEAIALDIRMWRDKQDVLHRVWERIYH